LRTAGGSVVRDASGARQSQELGQGDGVDNPTGLGVGHEGRGIQHIQARLSNQTWGPQRNNGITSIVCVIRVRVDAFDNAAPNPNNHNNHNSYNYNRCHHPHTRTWLWMESLNTTANNNKTKHCREQTKDPLPQA
jgi:hypothetical protein